MRYKPVQIVIILLVMVLVSCKEEIPPRTSTPTPVIQPLTTVMPEIKIVERETLIVGVDSAFPPFSDLDREGNPVGIEIDLLDALMETTGMDYQLISTGWDTLFLELVSGRYDAVLGGITSSDAPGYVALTEPLFEIGQVAVVLEGDLQIDSLKEIENLVVGVQPLSWGEFVITGKTALIQAPSGNIRRYKTEKELIDALFAGYVDVIITHNTVIESFDRINPSLLRQVPKEGKEGWLAEYSFHIAVPQGADILLQSLNDGIEKLKENGRILQIFTEWGFAPEFLERPKFVQDTSADSIIAGIEKIGNYSMRFVLNRPDPFFVYKLAVPAMAILSPNSLEQLYEENGEGNDERVENNNQEKSNRSNWIPAGTGPFIFNDWEPGVAITLTANTTYWGNTPYIDTIVVKPVADPHLRYELLRGNQVQLIENLSIEDLTDLDDNPIDQIEIYQRDPINIAYLGMNRDLNPFDNRNMRLAVAACINQTKLVEDFYPEESLIAQQFLPPNTFGFTPGLLWHDLDIGRSAQLLADAGFEKGIEITLTIPSASSDYLPDPLRIAEQVKEQLSSCNITATIQTLDDVVFTENLLAGDLAFHLSGWSADFPGPIGFLNTHFAGRGNGKQFGTPFPEIIDLLDTAAEQANNDVRKELYNHVNELLKEKVIFVPIAHASSTLAARDYVPGIETSPVRRELLSTIGPVTSTNPIFNYLVSSDPITLDPAQSVRDADFAVTNQVFETLASFEPATMILTGSLALEWTVNETFDVWEFTLRRGVVFHDGTRFDADAVIANFYRQWHTELTEYSEHAKKYRYFHALYSGFQFD